MKPEVNKLLEAINLADMDGLKAIRVDMKDLQELRGHILEQNKQITRLAKDVVILEIKLNMTQVEKPINLRAYAWYYYDTFT